MTYKLPVHAAAESVTSVPSDTKVQVIPSADTVIVPDNPVASNCDPDQISDDNCVVTPDVLEPQVVPVVDVIIVPAAPAATNSVPVHSTA
jgi:hypothetical protein